MQDSQMVVDIINLRNELEELEKYRLKLYEENLKVIDNIDKKKFQITQCRNQKLYNILTDELGLNNVLNAHFLGWKYIRVTFKNYPVVSFRSNDKVKVNNNGGNNVVYETDDPSNPDIQIIGKKFNYIMNKIDT